MKPFLIKVPEGMLELWRQAAEQRGSSLSQLIREAVNKDIEQTKAPAPRQREL